MHDRAVGMAVGHAGRPDPETVRRSVPSAWPGSWAESTDSSNVPPTTLTSPPPTYVGAPRPNVRWGGGDVARPRWEGTLATYVAVVPPSHLKGPLLRDPV